MSTFHLAYSTLYLCILPSGSFRLWFSSLINPFFWLFGYSCFTLKLSTSNVCSLKLCISLVNQRKWDMLSLSKRYFRKRQIKCFSKWVLLKWYYFLPPLSVVSTFMSVTIFLSQKREKNSRNKLTNLQILQLSKLMTHENLSKLGIFQSSKKKKKKTIIHHHLLICQWVIGN